MATASPARTVEVTDQSLPAAIGKVAVLPLENLTDSDVKYQYVVEQMQLALEGSGIDFVSTKQIRPFLREHRIRSRGSLSIRDARLLRDELAVDYMLVGSIDLIRDMDIPEFSLSLRLLSGDDVLIKSAVSVSASGHDYTRLFDVGTVEDIDKLVELVAANAVKQLLESLQKQAARSNVSGGGRWAVIPLDNTSRNRRAGMIVANWLVSDLVNNGYQVVEPGAIQQLFQKNGGPAVGGIDLRRSRLLYDSLGILYILTGEVDLFKPASGLLTSSTPELVFGTRVCDSQSGLVVATFESDIDGDQFETVFGMGRYYAMGKLAPRALKKMQDYFEKSLVENGAK
ncbi:MAG: hypothetical protein P1R58_12060 [bacterium]|nr:hypothetical protein [bacterium]